MKLNKFVVTANMDYAVVIERILQGLAITFDGSIKTRQETI